MEDIKKYAEKAVTLAKALRALILKVLAIFNVELDTGIDFEDKDITEIAGYVDEVLGAF